jgi:probable FeS assembly SUF system protein SufT
VERRIVPVLREVPARLVPTGDPIRIQKGAFVTLTQRLGGSCTVIVNGNMARIDGADADALGFEPEVLVFEPRPDGRVDPDQVHEALASVYDPEIPVSIVALGLIYGCDIGKDNTVRIRMTLTAPGCGMGTLIADEARDKILTIPGVAEAAVELVWDPPWSREMMSEAARLEMGLM